MAALRALPDEADTRPHVYVLGLDPGMRSVGWAVFKLFRDGALDLVGAGTFSTEKTGKAQKVLATDDNFRRARLVARHVLDLSREYGIKAICAESMSFPRSSSVAAKMAMCWGSIALLAELLDPLPVIQVSPQQIKAAAGVTLQPRVKSPKVSTKPTAAEREAVKAAEKQRRTAKAASKSDVQAAMTRRFPLLGHVLASVTKAEREHPADACGAVVCALASDEIRTLRSMIAA